MAILVTIYVNFKFLFIEVKSLNLDTYIALRMYKYRVFPAKWTQDYGYCEPAFSLQSYPNVLI